MRFFQPTRFHPRNSLIGLVSGVTLAACGGSDTASNDRPEIGQANMEITADGTPEIIMMSETFDVMNSSGNAIGTATITDQEVGGVVLSLNVTAIPEGTHAVHFHEYGMCDTPDFVSAGGHYNPNNVNHGFDSDDPNPHAGDMRNIEAPLSGVVQTEIRNERVTLVERAGFAPLFDEDGSALIIHAGADDYETQPTGAAGARIACAVIKAAN
jgi:Cu-Zn family superoxide dismutase